MQPREKHDSEVWKVAIYKKIVLKKKKKKIVCISLFGTQIN